MITGSILQTVLLQSLISVVTECLEVFHSTLNPTIYSVRVLQFTAVHAKSFLVEGDINIIILSQCNGQTFESDNERLVNFTTLME